MSTVGPETDDSTDGANPPGDSSEWDEEWLPDWVNVEDDEPAPAESEPELEEQLAADLEAVERLVASLLTESRAAFEASVGGWEPDELEEPSEPVAPVSELSSVGFSLGVARPVPAPVPLPEPPPMPAVVSPSAPRRRGWGWLVAPLVLLLAGAVIGMFMWAGSSGRPTPAAAVRTDPALSATSALPTWTRPADSEPTGPVPVTTSATSTSPAPVTSAPRVHRAAPRRGAHTSAAATVAPQHLVAPSIAVPPPSPTGTGPGPDSTNSSGSPSCSAANTDSTPTQTTGSTATSTQTTTATQTSTQTTAATDTSTPTLGSQPSLAPAVSCSN